MAISPKLLLRRPSTIARTVIKPTNCYQGEYNMSRLSRASATSVMCSTPALFLRCCRPRPAGFAASVTPHKPRLLAVVAMPPRRWSNARLVMNRIAAITTPFCPPASMRFVNLAIPSRHTNSIPSVVGASPASVAILRTAASIRPTSVAPATRFVWTVIDSDICTFVAFSLRREAPYFLLPSSFHLARKPERG